MATPPAVSPEVKAAAPVLIEALTDVKQFLTTVLTGDPLQIPLRAAPAAQVLLGQLQLLLPALANAEEPVVLQQATSGLDGLISKLQAIQKAG